MVRMSEREIDRLATSDVGALLDVIESGMHPSSLTFALERIGSAPRDSRIECALRAGAAHHDAVVREGAVLGMLAAGGFSGDLADLAATAPSPGVRSVATP